MCVFIFRFAQLCILHLYLLYTIYNIILKSIFCFCVCLVIPLGGEGEGGD